MNKLLLRRAAGAITIALMMVGSALAQNYPSRPITLVVPFAPGSGTDQVARGMSQALHTTLPGATVIVENKPGAGGQIAGRTVATAPNDGYTLFLTTNTTQSANPHLYKKLSYDPVDDFVPIAAIARGSMFLALPASSPIKSVADLIAEGKKRTLTYGAGNSSSRVAAEMFSQMTGIKFLYVPYKSNPQAVTDLVSGQVDFMFADPASSLPLLQAGKLKVLAYAGDKRSPAMPDLPTLQESGVKDYALYYWVAAYAPKDTPPDVVRRLNEAFVKGVSSDVITRVYNQAWLESFTTTSEGLAKFQKDETDKWGRVIKAAGIQPE